jgi:hypothetical protein
MIKDTCLPRSRKCKAFPFRKSLELFVLYASHKAHEKKKLNKIKNCIPIISERKKTTLN